MKRRIAPEVGQRRSGVKRGKGGGGAVRKRTGMPDGEERERKGVNDGRRKEREGEWVVRER